MSARNFVRWSSLLLALAGWGGAVWLWEVLGPAAGADGGFVLAVAVAITFTISCAQSAVLPDMARLHALGVREGVRLAACTRRHADASERVRHLIRVP